MGKVKKFLDIEFWAENGIVYLSCDKAAEGKDYASMTDDERLRVLKGLPPSTFIKRAIVLGIAFLRGQGVCVASERAVRKFLEDAHSVYQEAKKQGAVDSVKVDEYKLRHKIYKKPQIIVPGLVTPNGSSNSLETKLNNIDYRKALLEGFEETG